MGRSHRRATTLKSALHAASISVSFEEMPEEQQLVLSSAEPLAPFSIASRIQPSAALVSVQYRVPLRVSARGLEKPSELLSSVYAGEDIAS